MGFDEPKPFIYTAGNFGKNVSRVGVFQFVRFIDRFSSFVPEGGQGFGDRFDMRVPVRDIKRVLLEARAFSGDSRCALGDAPQLDDALGDQIHITLDRLIYLIEQFVQPDKMGAFDVPMRLLHLRLKIHCVCKLLVHQRTKLRTSLLGNVVLCLVHFRCFYSIPGRCFHMSFPFVFQAGLDLKLKAMLRTLVSPDSCGRQHGLWLLLLA